jgi:ATP phosphoribosyltransferase
MIALPKGSMEESTVSLFAKAGYQITRSSRSYKPVFDDPELDGRFIRSQEVSNYVESGFFDVGLCGHDWVVENGSDVEEVCSLTYSRATRRKARWVLAVPEGSPVREPKDLEGKRIATEVVNITRKYLAEHGVKAKVEFSWGATEVKVPDLVDAIVDVTETGSSLRANKLRIVDTLLETDIRLIANKAAWADPDKRRKIENLSLLLQAALRAGALVGLKMNIPRDRLKDLIDDIPALRKPTINRLSDEAWVAIDTIVDEKVVREILPRLRDKGAEGIIEYPLNKVVF